jgi:tetratricopeptide (TPR) repeat protein
MLSVFRKLLYFRNRLKRRNPEPDEIIEEKWVADFSKEKHARFDIKTDSAYDSSLWKNLFYSGHSLTLALKKTGCIAWVEAPERRYSDLVISGAIRIDAKGGYGAGGILFRMVDNKTYYSFLISSKGYFRLDLVRNGMPFPLVGWTELPLSTGASLASDQAVDFSVINYGSHIVIIIRGRWAAEVNDSSIPEGIICLCAASYESGDPTYRVMRDVNDVSYTTEVFLESLTVDSHIVEVSSVYEKWRDSPDIDSNARLRLAETFTATGQYDAAMVQLRKCWDTPGHKKTQRELLLAGRLTQLLGLMTDAENYISQCIKADVESHEGKEALTEMAKILNVGERFAELKKYCSEAIKINPLDPVLWNLLGHACWNKKEYKKAGAAYNRSFKLDHENGIFAKNAANVYDVMGRKKEALVCYLKAGRAFLKTGNYNDLGLLVPQLVSSGGDNWEARSLAGKWAFAVEDWKMAEKEFARAEELRKAKRPKPPKDGAQVFLEALLLIRAGKRRDALPFLEEAVSLEKNYALFRFRLAENLFLLDDDPDDPRMLKEMNTALTLNQKKLQSEETVPSEENKGLEGWINNFAAQVALRKGDLDTAAKHLEKAADILGDLPAVRVNQGVLFYLHGSLDKALELLNETRQDDPEGITANAAGNLLVRSGRFEEADEKYRFALSVNNDNVEYLCNRASCLMELGLYGEADKHLAKAHKKAPSPYILEMISYVAAKKGEYARAEQACRSALEIDPCHSPSLLSLGWILFTTGRADETAETISSLDKLALKENIAKGREELRAKLDEHLYRTIECANCERSWKVPKEPPPVKSIRLFAAPPDNMPAGSCPDCGKTYCIGCAKSNTDSTGRFICPACNRSLKLINEGLKKIIQNWAVKDGLVEPKLSETKRRRGRPPKSG